MTLQPVLRVLVLLSLALALVPATTESQRAQVPDVGPVAGPIAISTQAEIIASPLGTLAETTLIVENTGSEPVKVYLRGLFEWPDGSTQQLRYGPPMTIAVGETLILSALSPVPAGVGSGAATFTATAIVTAIGNGGRASYAGRLIAQASATFVLP